MERSRLLRSLLKPIIHTGCELSLNPEIVLLLLFRCVLHAEFAAIGALGIKKRYFEGIATFLTMADQDEHFLITSV